MVLPDDTAMYDGDNEDSEGVRMMMNMITEILYLYVIHKSLHYV